jgi:hypothetical protein
MILTHKIPDGIIAGLEAFRSISEVTIGDGSSTAFWYDLWFGDTTAPFADRQDQPPCPCCYNEISLVALRHDLPDTRSGRLTNKKLSNKSLEERRSSQVQDFSAGLPRRSSSPQTSGG